MPAKQEHRNSQAIGENVQKPQSYSYERASAGITEKIPPVLKVPGMRKTEWDKSIGRHVVVR